MRLLVLVIQLMAGLVTGLASACFRMTVHGAQLAGVLVRDDRRARARRAASPPTTPMPTSHKWIAAFFVIVILLMTYAVITYR